MEKTQHHVRNIFSNDGFWKSVEKIHMIGQFSDYLYYLNPLLTFIIKKKIKNIDIFIFGSLGLR